MLLFAEPEAYKPAPGRPLFLALGNFDGFHAGHRDIARRVIAEARKANGLAAFLTFREHPQLVLNPGAELKLLTPLEQKIFLLSEAGLDACFLFPFTDSFRRLEAEDFVSELLVKKLQAKKVFLGYSAHFGFKRRGTADLMKRLAATHGFEFEEVGPVQIEGQAVSSSRIREGIEQGAFEETRKAMARPFGIFAEVVRGDGRGASIGFRTANFDAAQLILPPNGVYPVSLRKLSICKQAPALGTEEWSFEFGQVMSGIANLGIRPTFHGTKGSRVLEVHVLDFEGDLYGQTFEVVFHPRIREERGFSGPDALKQQIRADIQAARGYFKGR